MFTVSCLITKNCLETVLEAQQHSHSLTKGQEGKKNNLLEPRRPHKTYTISSSNGLGIGRDEVGTSWGVSSGSKAELCRRPKTIISQSRHVPVCPTYIARQWLVSKQAWTVSGGSLDMSLVPITVLFHKMGSFIYFGLFTRFQVSTS